jgi:cell wall-associated NlpC family hydrolase
MPPPPPRARVLLLASALAAIVFGWAAAPSGLVAPRPAAAAQVTGMKATRFTLKRAVPTLGERATRIALQAVGVPYQWGGASPGSGFDCSGLVLWAYGRLGVELPHSSYALFDLGRPVALNEMKPGDMVFFSGLGHMGLYIGRGRMVHAPRSGRLVEVVPLAGSYYDDRLVGARRVTPT